MTIIVGFSASRQGGAPVYLAAQLARNTGENVVAAAVLDRVLPPGSDPFEDEYRQHIARRALKGLEQLAERMRNDTDISVLVHESRSVPTGLLELVERYDASMVVVGSSSSGLLGRVALGSVTEALVHTAAVPVAIAPRGYPQTPLPLERLTAAYGGSADAVGLLRMTAELAKSWSVEMRIAAFTVRPPAMFAGSIEPSAETLVIREWYASAVQGACDEIAAARTTVAVDNVDIVVGAGVEWRDAVDGIAWAPGDLLLLGSGAAGVRAQVFLGSAASRILRHAPVPVIIMPRT